MSSARRLLIVNADDFGFTRDVNAGILEAHERGILTSATLMATGAAFEDAVQRARSHPSLDVGCHLVLVGAPGLPESLPELVAAVAARRLPLRDILRAQVEKILGAGLQPTHVDTHKHTHLLPWIFRAVAQVAGEFGIRWVRRPLPLPGVDSLAGRILSRYGLRMTDHFAGFRLTGRLGVPQLVHLIRRLPTGLTELMCHPGRCGEELRRAPTRLKESREQELAALTAPEVREALASSGVRLVSFRDVEVPEA
ncbi:MAG: ChbG/HpnK family deacetylase [Bryobacterales bacterium]|nr:ChbG/HpnK family deacetylase [Bryobacteraceae bacterium]MDW8354863.1 ChbG/HpnK family deacetylase [Bryobacterales bacterium]